MNTPTIKVRVGLRCAKCGTELSGCEKDVMWNGNWINGLEVDPCEKCLEEAVNEAMTATADEIPVIVAKIDQ